MKIRILNMGLIEDTPIITSLLVFSEFERAMIIEITQGKVIGKTKEEFKEGG